MPRDPLAVHVSSVPACQIHECQVAVLDQDLGMAAGNAVVPQQQVVVSESPHRHGQLVQSYFLTLAGRIDYAETPDHTHEIVGTRVILTRTIFSVGQASTYFQTASNVCRGSGTAF